MTVSTHTLSSASVTQKLHTKMKFGVRAWKPNLDIMETQHSIKAGQTYMTTTWYNEVPYNASTNNGHSTLPLTENSLGSEKTQHGESELDVQESCLIV
ncbi:MAG: hypothetical protein JW384_01963 [Nitrosomonadaceae bacterium]|nr:hypothetical protein [Nitrosomonadaceae bacterium]